MQTKRALIVDDEPDIRELLEITLGRMDIETRAAADLRSARELLGREQFDLCLTDMNLPDGNGLELVTHIGAEYADLPVAVITAFGSADTAVSALKAGAFDFVQKPVDLEQLRTLVDSALKLSPLAGQPGSAATTAQLVGESRVIEALRGQIGKLARSQAPVYVSGESGSGKEVAARLIHQQGPRRDGEFVAVNCGAIPSELMESELFGHVKGSFTGAVADKQGLFQTAAGGTLFLDEVADLPLVMQVKLLRAIQEKSVRPVGARAEDITDVRIISATHKNLAAEVDAGRFRQDLYYRLNVIELNMPALREHPDDIPELVQTILGRLSADYQMDPPNVSAEALDALCTYDFPGNVRELENLLERAFALCENQVVRVDDLQIGGVRAATPPRTALASTDVLSDSQHDAVHDAQNDSRNVQDHGSHAATPPGGNADFALPELAPGESLEEFLENIERRMITDALESSRWNKTAAAKALGITFRALRYRLKKLDLE